MQRLFAKIHTFNQQRRKKQSSNYFCLQKAEVLTGYRC